MMMEMDAVKKMKYSFAPPTCIDSNTVRSVIAAALGE